jgi:Lar family restriction alleviation protein
MAMLTRCPFCGGRPTSPRYMKEIRGGVVGEKFFRVKCEICEAQGPPAQTSDEAWDAWGERHPSPPPAPLWRLHLILLLFGIVGVYAVYRVFT